MDDNNPVTPPTNDNPAAPAAPAPEMPNAPAVGNDFAATPPAEPAPPMPSVPPTPSEPAPMSDPMPAGPVIAPATDTQMPDLANESDMPPADTVPQQPVVAPAAPDVNQAVKKNGKGIAVLVVTMIVVAALGIAAYFAFM